MDKSNGYEDIAKDFIQIREQSIPSIGTSSVRNWLRTLPLNATILDLGCGTGIPVTKVLVEAGMVVYGIDASPTLVKAFQRHFPTISIACEAVEDSFFFHRKFDGIIAWGFMYLLSKEVQAKVIKKAADALRNGGTFLFTAPYQKADWKDILTGRHSISLGIKRYKALLSAAGLSLIATFEDEGKNHYYHVIKS